MTKKGLNKGTGVTTSELAAYLGLSRWTVSRVLNGHEGILPQTVKKVEQGMAELGFQPNALARSLRGGKSGMIGVCFQELGSPILASKVAILQQMLRAHGHHTMIELTNGSAALESQVIRHFLSSKVEGIVLIGSLLDESHDVFKVIESNKVPVVWVDPNQVVKGHEITIDRSHAMKLVLTHLYELGHRKFGILGLDPNVGYSSFRLNGIYKTAKKLKLSEKQDFFNIYDAEDDDHTYTLGYALAERMLKEVNELPTAIIAINDRVAIGAIKRLKEAGIAIPGALSVVGYDNLDVSDFIVPTLTTVDQCSIELMEATCKTLFDLIDSESTSQTPHKQLIKPQLIQRESATAAT